MSTCEVCGVEIDIGFINAWTRNDQGFYVGTGDDHCRELRGTRFWCLAHAPTPAEASAEHKALSLDRLSPQDRYLQLLVDGMEQRPGHEPTTLVSVQRLRSMEAALGLLRLTYRPMDPWETYIIRTELEEVVGRIPLTQDEQLVSDLVQMRNDLA